MYGYELSEVKLSRVCGVTHTADTCGEFRVVRHPDNTSSNTGLEVTTYLCRMRHRTHTK